MEEETTNRRRRSKRKKKKWSNKKKVIISIIMVLLLIVGIVFGGYFYIKSKIFTGNISSGSSEENDSQYKEVQGITNILLVGTDARTLDESSRSDSMIIATLDNNNKKIKLTSLFRDTMVNIPGYGEYKLNAAYELGGPELLLKTIKNSFGVKIDKYVMINFWGFEAVIDQIGGIEADIKDYQLEELNKYIGESTGGNDCPVTKTGVQVLNGKQALSYARIRHNVGDEFERTSRQQEVIGKIAEKLKVTSPTKYLGAMNKMLDYIKTNIDPMEALNMAFTIYKMPSLQTEHLQIPVPQLTDGREYKDLGWVFLMDQKQNMKILSDFIFHDKITSESEYDLNSLRDALYQYKLEEGNNWTTDEKSSGSGQSSSGDRTNIPTVPTTPTVPSGKLPAQTPPTVEDEHPANDGGVTPPTNDEEDVSSDEADHNDSSNSDGSNNSSDNDDSTNNGHVENDNNHIGDAEHKPHQ